MTSHICVRSDGGTIFDNGTYELLAGQAYYYFLDGYSGYNQIYVDPTDQEKIDLTCPFKVFINRRIVIHIPNAPTTFQKWNAFYLC